MRWMGVVVFGCLAGSVLSAPPLTDYCEMLARDIEGKQYSFIAGNTMYYIGGKVDSDWRPVRHETIGLMHPGSIEYFQFMRRSCLKIECSVNGSEKRDITPDMLFHGKDR